MYSHVCRHCKNTFSSYYKTRTFCSQACRVEERLSRRWRVCSYCGNSFLAAPSQVAPSHKGNIYCSMACKGHGTQLTVYPIEKRVLLREAKLARQRNYNREKYHTKQKDDPTHKAKQSLRHKGIPLILEVVECTAVLINIKRLIKERKKHER